MNGRLVGHSLAEIRAKLGERLRDAGPGGDATEWLTIFVQEGEQLFDVPGSREDDAVVLGQASVLVEQPEFAGGEQMKRLIALIGTRSYLAAVLRDRATHPGVPITI